MAGLYAVCALMVLGSMLTFHIVSARGPITELCLKIDACSCRTESGLVIDLSPLDSGDYLKPAFYDVSVEGISRDKFSWNPCTPFCESRCEGAAMCQVQSRSQNLYYTTGTHASSLFSLDYATGSVGITGLVIAYSHTSNSITRHSVVRLICDENSSQDRLIPFGETSSESAIYTFDLVSKYACPRKIPIRNGTTPVIPACPSPWTTKATETTTRTTPTTTTHHPTLVTPKDTPVLSIGKLMWIAVGIISSLLLIILVFIIVLIVRLGNNSEPGAIMFPAYNKSVSAKINMDDGTKAPLRY